MKIAGINKNSFVDMKGMIAYVVFTAGCNLDCWYCHNRHIIGQVEELMPESEVLLDLNKRKGFVDIVVISGGEPTLQPDLKDFIVKVREMGFKVKLDTNGTSPKVLQELIAAKLLDYVAMDIKAPAAKYSAMGGTDRFNLEIEESIHILMRSNIDYEFRTTFAPGLDKEDIIEIAERIKGAKLYTVQQCNKTEYMGAGAFGAHSPEYIRKTADEANKWVKTVVKGAGIF